ncbi:MAG TPA: transporter [Stellaceae bacterium]|nr:transporter [Stellaceae bacterium]
MPRPSRRFVGALLVALGCAVTACAARADGCADASQDIVTDRPSVTNSSVVVPAGSLQLENGINWTAHPGQDALDGPNTRLRFGLGGCTEVLVDTPDYIGGIDGHGPSGFSDVAPAVKHQFQGLPEGLNLSGTVGLAFPTGSRAIAGNGYNPYVQLPWTQDLGGGWTAGGMFSTMWLTGEPQSTTVLQPSVLIDRQIGEHSDVFAEYIGDYETRGLPAQELNFGGSYRFAHTQQIDFHVGVGLNRNAPDYFVGLGYSVRFDGLW